MPQLQIANTKFILPTAEIMGVRINGGMPMPAWSDIYGLEEDSPEDREGFMKSAKRVNNIIQAEIDKGTIQRLFPLINFFMGIMPISRDIFR